MSFWAHQHNQIPIQPCWPSRLCWLACISKGHCMKSFFLCWCRSQIVGAIYWAKIKCHMWISTSDFTSVCSSVWSFVSPFLFTLYYFKSYHKLSVIKVYWYLHRVKNMHFMLPSDFQGPWGKAKLSYVHGIIRQGETKLHVSKLTSVFHHLPSFIPSSCVR